ncbi:single-stranded-DNA-specific exonuclease RecJ [Anabaena cylindrica FACHB-243]|uniref:Single-stranded-DNA-specific exonuclease RecJ n=1 Tax=Anabaena cylindrica (strain ATCC 27899 / PCC 7122) TaxID=272123 RepID=K9ZFA7_ANACC|nr:MULTISPECIES: single-stranded-DNA-specific exonuclease RecJ [Anabaena]AFZ57045.1 putative exonuclease, RecJ [Anabaena cylindrica PCC 7122]MBD2421484.1 single-stranded-DNA-specific exonuclease RecJ [Anabaena cylindrica FACHB-243]MBY5284675.1 single-stranded-DNA-specific exonuclease RecJ [Anabaena sp. CCAP 1446/1C]MBY5311416.1 single-stranded-DNA-specific exonuclease RecJ [Anabaena sp. CCAP 1446/1C]MCM2407755.1 single-stranded-DNA-specific exonuclease RecJ [Anabaena sp. CCAP 1446/1C]
MQWILTATEQPPSCFIQAVKQYTPLSSGVFAAQLLWQRGIKNELQLAAFANFQKYQPASPFEFGTEMHLAVKRLKDAGEKGEKVAIWGDFDADGITSTSVLWDGLGQFFIQNKQLTYYIPNRLKESHGLNQAGIDNLAEQGCKLIVTCDTGSTNIDEIIYAQQLGIDVIVTDHHTLPLERPPVSAIINPRYLPKEHPLFHLSGVAVAYKLVEALYETLPDIPQHPLTDLLDLVAVGLIADLVQLSGDCRYLAQLGIQQLQADYKKPVTERRRPGVGRLLELCQKNGDRPTDISFGLGPRINAVSRIHGDATFCVELLTSRDIQRCQQLAEETELANSRRKSLQKDVQNQVFKKLSQLDLSTTSVIVLEDPQWPSGVLGLVAGQVAQETGRPTILLSTESGESQPIFARGSARSINAVDLYQLVKEQAHLLHRFGGHPFAAGLSLLVENIPLFTDAINQKLRQSLGGMNLAPTVTADLEVKVADLGKELFLELKVLEPCGMGNPIPKLLIKNCWFENSWHRNQQDLQGKKIQYIKTEFDIRDDSTHNPFPGIWWGHYKDELPLGRCDCIAEIDYNSYKKRYEIRLVAVRPSVEAEVKTQNLAMILDWRNQDYSEKNSVLKIPHIPTSWDDLRAWFRKSLYNQQQLALAWSKPQNSEPKDIWFTLVGIAKYLSRTNQPVTRIQLLEKLGISDKSLHLGFQALKYLGFTVQRQDRSLQITWNAETSNETNADTVINQFLAAVREEQFQQEYFTNVPLSIIQAMITFDSLL